MTEEEIQEYIEEAAARGISLGLETMAALMDALGNPEQELRCIHIAGTNGKGSVLAYISTVLRCAGYRVGRYYSPALRERWENIQVGGRRMTARERSQALKAVRDAASSADVAPTVFEIETAVALLHFAHKRCDIVVLECGMGGALDATNIIPAARLCVFTPIGADHTGLLGRDVTQIAQAKAGIMKTAPEAAEGGRIAVSASQPAKVAEALATRAGACGYRLRCVRPPEQVQYGMERQTFAYPGCGELTIRLPGVHQVENAALAVEALLALREQGMAVPEAAIREGLAQTVWEGRLTLLQRRPVFLMDGAHNAQAAQRLSASLRQCFPGQRFILVMGVLRDKAYMEILRELAPWGSHLVTLTPPDNPRALTAMELAEAAQEMEALWSVTAAGSVEEAVEMALLISGGREPILATGSLSYLGRLADTVRAHKRGQRVIL